MNENQLSSLVVTVSDSGVISGDPGDWAFNQVHFNLMKAAVADVGGVGGGGAVAAPPANPNVTPAQAALINQAVVQSNAAATLTPAAATGEEVTSKTASSTIASVLTGLNVIADIGDDISNLEAGGKAHLHWWGWEASLDEVATQALIRLLGRDITELATVLAALAAIIPVAAAIGGCLGIVAAALAAQVNAADSNNPHTGVSLKGYLWVGLSAKPLAV